ncbi:MAG: 50S ribosomal protein L15 [Spirochaetaceae bacterium]|jgi:large subunit ribosomal protein L15|nr:50S ribosomal protein L15 [Spirochaetaceae bacterium]
MQDFNLHAPKGANKERRILGRGQGSGRGTTAGKGNKGQKSRSGGKTYVGFEGGQMPLFRRLAQRGFSNHPFKKEFQIVNLGEIEKRFEDGETVDTLTLIRKGLAKGTLKAGAVKRLPAPVKILGDGDFTRKLSFNIGKVSVSAKEKIEKAGGNIAAPNEQ